MGKISLPWCYNLCGTGSRLYSLWLQHTDDNINIVHNPLNIPSPACGSHVASLVSHAFGRGVLTGNSDFDCCGILLASQFQHGALSGREGLLDRLAHVQRLGRQGEREARQMDIWSISDGLREEEREIFVSGCINKNLLLLRRRITLPPVCDSFVK